MLLERVGRRHVIWYNPCGWGICIRITKITYPFDPEISSLGIDATNALAHICTRLFTKIL